MSAKRVARNTLWIVLVLIIVSVAVFGWNLSQVSTLKAQPVTSVAAAALLRQPIADTTPQAEQVRRGQYLVAVGDCMSCHLRPGGEPFAGGRGLNTPFGVIYSSNITSDAEAGIGAWTSDQFHRAMHEGKNAHGQNLYPAFPYPWFNRVSRADDDAIFAYLKTTRAVHYTPPADPLPFPLNIRAMVGGWNLLFFRKSEFKADPRQSAEWNRGAYIVNGLGHCSACHTAKNMLGADKSGHAFEGGVLEDFVAPDLTGNPRTGLGAWSVDDITEYLHAGRNARAGAGGPMADVITYSTSLMTDQDRHAIATYLKSLPASPNESLSTPDASAMKRGAAIYSDACTGCHLENGVGQPRLFPPLGKNAVVQQNDPTGVIHLILAGGRIGPGANRPSPLSMPSFAWKLTDQEVADVATYLRNSWGNQASVVVASKVHDQRKRLGLQTLRLTDNSGDHQ
ncbi:c-type cytochrome [Rhodanobacter sp. Col0626]|uniref:c-type cytochrome n=1 Tax=Rhodanobacter sp. Col0626 TaxID=3415679 RepID=UPI003CED79BB